MYKNTHASVKQEFTSLMAIRAGLHAGTRTHTLLNLVYGYIASSQNLSFIQI